MQKLIIIILVFFFSIFSFAQEANKESLTKLYIATFDRAPDVDGINYWISTNMNLEQVAQSFFDQDETRNKYPSGVSTGEFVVKIYENLFKRSPDRDGQSYWVSELDSGNIVSSSFILAVINGAKDSDALILDNKTQVGEYFMANNLSDINQALEVMSEVTADSNTIITAKSKIDTYAKSVGACTTLNHNNGKTSFNGTYVKVDSLGNVCTKENGVWKAFFPMIIYPGPSSQRADYGDYTVGGRFNTLMSYDTNMLQHAKNAGMKGILDTDYYQSGGLLAGMLAQEIATIKANGLFSDLLFYYTDYEDTRVNAWSWHEEKKAIIAQEDPNGHPNYFLNGNSITNPKSQENIYTSGHSTSDIIGTYVYERWNDYQPNGPKRVIHLEIGEQTNPTVVAQINYGVGGDYAKDPVGHRFTPIAMASVAQGAKAIAFWKDWGDSVGIGVESNTWWSDLPKFNANIQKMMSSNIVQSLHNPFDIVCNSHNFTDEHGRSIVLDNIYQKDEWGYYLIPDDDLGVSVGSRLVNGKGYAILSNWHSSSQNFECTVNTAQMGYSFTKLYNFIDDQDGVGSVSGSTFKITVPAYGWVVVKFL